MLLCEIRGKTLRVSLFPPISIFSFITHIKHLGVKSDTGYIYCLSGVFFLSPNIFIVGRKVSEMHLLISFPQQSIPYSRLSDKISVSSFEKFYLQPKMSLNLASINYEMFVVFLMRGYETQILDEDFKLYWNDLISLFTSSLKRGVRKICCQSLILIRTLFYNATANPLSQFIKRPKIKFILNKYLAGPFNQAALTEIQLCLLWWWTWWDEDFDPSRGKVGARPSMTESDVKGRFKIGPEF